MPPGSAAHDTLSALLESDATGLIRDLLRLEDLAAHPEPVDDSWLPEESRPPLLLAVARGYHDARLSGREAAAALEIACAALGHALDPDTAQALRGALREAGAPASPAASRTRP